MAELIPPLVRLASTVGTPAIAWSVRLVVMFTMWPEPRFSISAVTRCVMWKKPATFVVIFEAKSAAV